MPSDHKLEGGDFLDLVEQPVTGWSISLGLGGRAIILSATLRAEPPEGEHEDHDRPPISPKDQPAWMKEATIELAMSDEVARALLQALQHHLADKR